MNQQPGLKDIAIAALSLGAMLLACLALSWPSGVSAAAVTAVM